MEFKEIEKSIITVMEAEKEKMYRYAYFRIGNQDDAKDAVQETCLALCQKETQILKVKDIHSYAWRSLSNTCTAILRKRIQQPQHESLDGVTLPDLTPQNLDEEFALINRLLGIIPPEQSEVIRLHIHGGMTFTDIAQTLDIPPTTAKSRFKYGIDKLRDALEKQGMI